MPATASLAATRPLTLPPLLGPGDPPPVEVLNRQGRSKALLLCDHASNRVPSGLDLGVPQAELERHIGYDIGGRWMTERLMERLDAAAVFSAYSRLVVDLNRGYGDPTSIPEVSDGTVVPGNRGIGEEEVARRMDALYHPYHAAVAGELARMSAEGYAPAVISMHSFTPCMKGFRRPWHVGVLWDYDPRMPVPLIASLLRRGDVCVGDNQPYSGRGLTGHTIDVHCAAAGLPNVLIEVRQDLIATEADAHRWADILYEPLVEILFDPDLYVARRYEAPGLPVP